MARILLIEDNGDMLQALTEALEINDHEVIPVQTGVHGLEVLENGDMPPDIIITDVRMPGMDGVTFVQHVRDCADWDGIPIALMSGQPRDMDHVATVGADTFIPKPFKFEQLHQIIDELLEKALQGDNRRLM